MRPTRWQSLVTLVAGVGLVAAACSSAASTPAATVLSATATPVVTVAPSAMATAASGVTIGTAQSALGSFLTGPSGHTLYVFAADTTGKSNCNGSCATNWPALTAASGATITGPTGATGTFSLITRDDGTMQVAYNGMPLYYFKGDSAAGDTNGQGIAGKWSVAPLSGQRPAAGAASPAPASQPAGTTGY
jgi:predicted lipoprotein with Yx(FWY)xxD motif